MEFTVSKMDIVIDYKQGYAFIDKNGNCMIVTYGDANVKMWTKYLEND